MYWAKYINKCPPVSYKDDKEQGDEVCQRSFQNCETNNSLRREDGQAQCLGCSEHFLFEKVFKQKSFNLRSVTVTSRRTLLRARRVINQSPGLARRQTSNLNNQFSSCKYDSNLQIRSKFANMIHHKPEKNQIGNQSSYSKGGENKTLTPVDKVWRRPERRVQDRVF